MSDYYSSFQNRFAGFGIPGIPGMRTTQQAFQMATSAHYRQFHQMKAQMPSDVLELFKANQIVFLRAPKKKKCRPLDPISTLGINIVQKFQIPNLQLMEQQKRQTRDERKDRIALQKAQLHYKVIEQEITQWNPFEDEKIVSDPDKTLIVARLDFQTTQGDLRYQFEKYGIIKNVRIIKDMEQKSRGYGFIEFDSKSDFLTAYKQGNHRKIDGKKVTVDYQKGRTLLRWKPRRFGGGDGGQSRMTKSQNEKRQKQQKLKQQKRMKMGRDREKQKQKQKVKQKRQKQRNNNRSKSKQFDRERSFRKQQKRKDNKQVRQGRQIRDNRDRESKTNSNRKQRDNRQRDYYQHSNKQTKQKKQIKDKRQRYDYNDRHYHRSSNHIDMQ